MLNPVVCAPFSSLQAGSAQEQLLWKDDHGQQQISGHSGSSTGASKGLVKLQRYDATWYHVAARAVDAVDYEAIRPRSRSSGAGRSIERGTRFRSHRD